MKMHRNRMKRNKANRFTVTWWKIIFLIPGSHLLQVSIAPGKRKQQRKMLFLVFLLPCDAIDKALTASTIHGCIRKSLTCDMNNASWTTPMLLSSWPKYIATMEPRMSP